MYIGNIPMKIREYHQFQVNPHFQPVTWEDRGKATQQLTTVKAENVRNQVITSGCIRL